MQYRILEKGIQPNKDELNAIDAKIGLSLSRFTNIIVKCEIGFSETKVQQSKSLVACTITVCMTKNTEFVVSDTAKTINEAFPMALVRIKRNIERHLKRNNAGRQNSSMNSRAY